VSEAAPKRFYVTGPTGSGKSAIALELARLVGGEIVNADAFQVYSGLNILTARPSSEDEARTPHHLYGVLSPTDTIDANRYALLAEERMAGISKSIVVGGSGLYVKALTHGMNEIPPANPALRAELEELDETALRARLREVDAASEVSIEARNLRYLRRALEITLSCGRPASEVRQSWKTDAPDLRGVLINRSRPELFDRINRRVERMFAEGVVEEVRNIADFSELSAKAIGVREIKALLLGEIDEKQCIEQIQFASRQYAKRQMTWFRREKWLTSWPLDETISDLEAARAIADRFFGEKA